MALTKERAEARFACIKLESIIYDFNISLQLGSFYEGLGQISFELKSVPTELVIDFKSQQIKKILINNVSTEWKVQHQNFVFLDVTKLKLGQNSIAVQYRNKYDNDGSGCVSFTDVDTKQYLYTQFEPFFANRVFPVFDQPDLKAKMRLNIVSPSALKKILSNQYPILEKDFSAEDYIKTAKTSYPELLKQFLNGKSGIMTLFPETKMLPTYLFCFVAGDYQQLKVPNPYKGIPMSIYSIQSLYEHLKQIAPFIFEVTIQSLKFFESFFGFPFSFNKYDQIFVHEYKWGAMQNAGIVTFNDIYVWKEKVSTDRMLGLANTISHQLAHHWFGNLVTMKWWDDLWLNESFADFISHFCLEKIKNNMTTLKYESSMASFLYRKGWGYHEDQRVTTHPIRGPVANTSVAESIFDGITYSKGAATMKQLLILMGEDNFSKALSQYFAKYAWKNAVLGDFIDQMQRHFTIKQFDLSLWRQLWLQKASLNQLEPHWDHKCEQKLTKLTIKQTAVAQEHPTLRPHKIAIGFFKQDCTVDEMQILIRPTQHNQLQFSGSNRYKAILLNYGDYSFVKTVIDPVSLNFFSNNLNQIKDVLSRTLIWKSFFDMLKDAKITSIKYIEIFIKNITRETSDSIFEKHFDYIYAAVNSYTPSKYRQSLNDLLFYFILSQLIKSSNGQDNRTVILKERLCNFALSPSTKKILIQWKYKRFQPLSHLEMTVGQQWRTVTKAFTLKDLTIQEKQKIFQDQKTIDSSDTSSLKRLTCDGLKSTEEQFEKLYLSYQDPKNQLSVAKKNASTSGWNNTYHSERLLKYKDRYFKDIIQASKVLSGDHLQAFIQNLQPIDDNIQQTINRYAQIKLDGQKFDKINIEIRKIVDDLKRYQRAYVLYQKEQSKL